MKPKTSLQLGFLTATFAALVVSWALPVGAQTSNGVFLPDSTPYSKTYAQWSAGWWQWNYSLPTTNSPIQDTAPISTGQSGPVWFLGGTFGLGGNQTRTRSGSVPEGTALFIAIMESWADDADCPNPDSYTTAQLRSLAASAQDPAFAMSCTIDGLTTVDLNSLPNAYRVQSPVFNYTVPGVHNYLYDLFGATCYLNPDGTPFAITGAVADGVYLMVAPLATGDHTIHFSGSYPFSIFPFPPVTYVQDITYNLTVVPTPALTLAPDGSGGYFLDFKGVPDLTYRLQRAPSVTGPWSAIVTNITPASGLIKYHETSPPPGAAFYRTAQS
jgi:hypothetical protein